MVPLPGQTPSEGLGFGVHASPSVRGLRSVAPGPYSGSGLWLCQSRSARPVTVAAANQERAPVTPRHPAIQGPPLPGAVGAARAPAARRRQALTLRPLPATPPGRFKVRPASVPRSRAGSNRAPAEASQAPAAAPRGASHFPPAGHVPRSLRRKFRGRRLVAAAEAPPGVRACPPP